MRTIPPDLKSKINKKCQTIYEKANPKLKVLLSRGFVNELFQVFTITEGSTLEEVDVSIKRTDTSSDPVEVFALALNNGTAIVKRKPLPYDDQYPWVDEFLVDFGVSAVAIEFDGYWERDIVSKKFNFVTEDVPWIFYVIAGTLYAQYWKDDPTVLATNVSKVRAIRGWLPANGDTSNDQGLIVAYLKNDGIVYYRSYCVQDGGLKAWETERTVTEFTGTVSDLALVRTNDFRVGFLAQIDGEIHCIYTARNYAGMSFGIDVVTLSSEIHSATATIFEIVTNKYDIPSETVMFSEIMEVAITNLFEATPASTVYGISEAKVTGPTTISVKFNCGIAPVRPEFLLHSMTLINATVTNAQIQKDGSTIVYTISPPLDAVTQAVGRGIVMTPNTLLLKINANRQEFYVGSTMQALGILPPHTSTIGMSFAITSASATLSEITTAKYDVLPKDTIIFASLSVASASCVLTDTGYIPV